MKVVVEFTKDFATKKKGDIESYDSMLACSLITKKVAKQRQRKTTKKVEKNEPN